MRRQTAQISLCEVCERVRGKGSIRLVHFVKETSVTTDTRADKCEPRLLPSHPAASLLRPLISALFTDSAF